MGPLAEPPHSGVPHPTRTFHFSISFQLASAVVGLLALLGCAWYAWAARSPLVAAVWRAIPDSGRGTLVVFAALSVLSVGLVVYGASEWFVFRPLKRLLCAIDQVRSGEYRAILPQLSHHELGGVEERFRELLQQVVEFQESLAILSVAGRTLTSQFEIDELLQQVLEMIEKKFAMQSCAIFVPGDDGCLRIRYQRGMPSDIAEEAAVQVGEGACGQAYATHQVRVIQGDAGIVAQDPFLHQLRLDCGIQSAAFLPLLMGGRTMGVFNVNALSPQAFPPDRLHTLSALTEYLAIAIRNARLYAELQQFSHRLEEEVKTTTQELTRTNIRLVQRVRELKALYEIASPIAGVPDVGTTLRRVAEVIAQAMEADVSLFFLLDETRQTLVASALPPAPTGSSLGGANATADTDRPLEIPVADVRSVVAKVFREGKAMLARRLVMEGDSSPPLTLQPLKAHLMVPLQVGRRPMGVLWVGRRDPGSLTEDHLRLGELIADRTAVVIENARLYERLQHALHELERLNRMKTEFISMVSHELRTPVTTLKGVLSLVLGGEVGPLQPQQEKFLTSAAQAVERLIFLISDLLDISRIEAGQIKMRPRRLPLRDLVQQAGHEFQRQAKEKSVTLKVSLAPRLPHVMGDPDRLFQVVSNLLSNAIKFTPSGGQVTLEAQAQEELAMISVSDTGPGIAPAEHERVFEKFYQVDSSATRLVKGSGLGLAIVKAIVELHGGRVWVESEIGRGSTFRVTLPRAKEVFPVGATPSGEQRPDRPEAV